MTSTTPVSGIAPIAGIAPIPAIPRIVAGSFRAGNRFRLDDWPEASRKSFARGRAAWLEALDEAIGLGIDDEKRLADLIFFMHHPERMKPDGDGRLIDAGEDQFVQLRAEWEHERTIVARRIRPGTVPPVFLKARQSKDYGKWVAAPTRGAASLFVDGRKGDGNGKYVQAGPACEELQKAVEAAAPGDFILIANWQFMPWNMNLMPPGSGHWDELLLRKAREGVQIRVLISAQPPRSPFATPMGDVEAMVKGLDPKDRPNFKYFQSPHPHVMGTHHQKLLIVAGDEGHIAFCGGIDISGGRTPNWSNVFVWHDIEARFEGSVASDLEREFVERWNREKAGNRATELPEWGGLETLRQSKRAGGAASSSGKMQVQRTVSKGPFGRDIQRDDVWQGYFRLIGRATKLLYLENQYFHEPLLAAAIARQARAQKDLQVIVAVSTGTDDTGPGVDQAQLDWVANSRALRFEFFQELVAIPRDRLRVYTIFYPGGLLHSKLVLADDQVLSIGSANANPRGFFFDSEINVTIEDPKLVKELRHRLWAHNLGMKQEVVSRWRDQDYFQMWDVIAGQNLLNDLPQATPAAKVRSATIKMFGDMVLPFAPLDKKDPRFDRGKKGKITMPFPIPDLSPQRSWF